MDHRKRASVAMKIDLLKEKANDIIRQTQKTSSIISGSANRDLIISTGDISDIDGFMALAKYAQTEADVLFIMNYPEYLKERAPAASTSVDELNKYGLGYTYDENQYFEASDKILIGKTGYDAYEPIRNMYRGRTKQFFTDLGFAMAFDVWDDTPSRGTGKLYFCVGGINDINPFHKEKLKNEMFVYRDVGSTMKSLDTCNEGDVFDKGKKKVDLIQILSGCNNIHIDFNGSMAFLNQQWKNDLKTYAKKIMSVFVMGGVFSYTAPCTMPAIKDSLNRMSCSTMNQLYSPKKSFEFLKLMELWGVPIFIIANNVVQEFGGIGMLEIFLNANRIYSEKLLSMALSYYGSHYNPPKKPFDFYTALALVENMKSVSVGSKCNLCLDWEYGVTLITGQNTCGDAINEYTKQSDTYICLATEGEKMNKNDDESSANKKKNLACEQIVLSFAKCEMIYGIIRVEFEQDEQCQLKIKRLPG